jgi:hypothetical protein
MRALWLIPITLLLAMAIGWAACMIAGWDPRPPQMVAAAAVMLSAATLGGLVLMLVRQSTQAAVAQSALVGMSVHLFAALVLGGVVYFAAFAPESAFALWLLVFYWASLPPLAAAFIRVLRAAPFTATGH